MGRWDGFGRSLLFAAGAAGALPLFVIGAAPWLGAGAAARGALLAVAAVYAWGLGGDRRRRRGALAAALAAATALSLLPLGLSGTALGAAGVVALCRSGIHYRQRPLRAVAIEGALGTIGLGVAAFLASGGLVGLALALWGYLLVQSAYFLIGGCAPRGSDPAEDRFERARARLERLLAEARTPVAR